MELFKFINIMAIFGIMATVTLGLLLMPFAAICVPVLLSVFFTPMFGIGVFCVVVMATGICVFKVVEFLAAERSIIDEFGAKKALWTVVGTHPLNNTCKKVYRQTVLHTWDNSTSYILRIANHFGFTFSNFDFAYDTGMAAGSMVWSNAIILVDDAIHTWTFWWSLAAVAGFISFYIGRKTATLWKRVMIYLYVMVLVTLHLSEDVNMAIFKGFVTLVVGGLTRNADGRFRFLEWLEWRVLSWVTKLTLAVDGFNHNIRVHYSEQLAGKAVNADAQFKRFVVVATKVITDMKLPSFIRRTGHDIFGLEALRSGRSLMQSIGWPINVEIQEPNLENKTVKGFKEWILAGSDFQTGIKQLKLEVSEDINTLRASALRYKRTETYRTIDNETIATSRYFQDNKFEYPDLHVDDVWPVVADIFRNSRLTPFNTIIHAWEKKYALGFFMVNPFTRKKYKRRDFIAKIGMPAFKELWARTFYYASLILPVAHVSVKDEALPEKKWIKDKVRSVIGSPLSQYIASTVFNYHANHNFQWESTPIKVGMPLNGYQIGKIFESHSRFEHHFEGDFSEFDSTIQSQVVDLIKEVRKKGFEYHKDSVAISRLIDDNYDFVTNQLLGQTSTGNIYKKGSGLTTGHSSTSMDNSLACVILYLMAWKQLTGLSAEDFLHYNQLSNYGDDHIFSFSAAKPRQWTPRNIMKVMSGWGVKNNIEVKNLYECTFLSKGIRKSSPSDLEELKSIGKNLTQVVYHDREKLLGKFMAPLKSRHPSYRLKRMFSYLDLCAHHKDIYDTIVAAIINSKSLSYELKQQRKKIPKYEDVLRSWYKRTDQPQRMKDEDLDYGEEWNNGSLLTYGAPSTMDLIMSSISNVPDLLNPVLFNLGFSRALQRFLRPSITWVVDLFMLRNGVINSGSMAYFIKSTPYRVLDTAELFASIDKANPTTLLVRHWLFLLYDVWAKQPRALSIVEFMLRKFANFSFILNAKVVNETAAFSFAIDKILIIALLNVIHVPNVLFFMKDIILPDLNVAVDLLYNRVMSYFWSTIPPNYNDVIALLPNLKDDVKSLLVKAPTGTGKSTGMIFTLKVHAHKFNKIIVVEPRHLLVTSLVSYTNETFGMDATAGTIGEDFDESKRVWYVTPQFLWSKLHILKKSYLVVIDEAHIEESPVQFTIKLIELLGLYHILTTATPTLENISQCGLFVDLPIAKLYKTDFHTESLTILSQPGREFMEFAVRHASQYNSNLKILYILDTPELARQAATMSNIEAVSLSSIDRRMPDKHIKRIFATNVIDVGITIDNLDIIVYPDWHYDGKVRRVLPDAQRVQRNGRVGRTRNGDAIMIKTNVDKEPAWSVADITATQFASLVVDGLPAPIAAKINIQKFLQGFGIENIHMDKLVFADVVRGCELFVKNMRPVMHLAAVGREHLDIGENTIPIIHSGGGNLSLVGGDLNNLSTHTLVDATAHVLRSALNLEVTPSQEESFKAMSYVAGPLVRVANMGAALINDLQGSSDAVNPLRSNGNESTISQIREVGKIMKLLHDFDSQVLISQTLPDDEA